MTPRHTRTDNLAAMGSPRDGEIATALAVLEGAWNAERIAAWALRGADAVPLCMRHWWHADLELGKRIWRERAADLRAGHKVRVSDAEFHPLRDGNQVLLGFVQFVPSESDAVTPTRMEGVAEKVLVELSAAISALDVADAPTLCARALHTWRAQRAELVLALDHYEWNFTRFAKARGVTRQTVRNWTHRFKIIPPSWARRRRPPRE